MWFSWLFLPLPVSYKKNGQSKVVGSVMPNLARFREFLRNTPPLRGCRRFAARVSLSMPGDIVVMQARHPGA